METPTKVTPAQFHSLVDEYLKEKCDVTYVCRGCGGGIQAITAFISIHDSMLHDCAGWGDVKRMPIPYCPKCEPRPSEAGCVHLETRQVAV